MISEVLDLIFPNDVQDIVNVSFPYLGSTFRRSCKYGINTAMKPYRTLRQLLVHPKDQRTVEQTGECVYCTGFRATTATVHILERPAEIMGRDKRNTEKK